MHQLIALYNQPEDPAAFDKHYTEVHAPIAKRLAGLERYTLTHPGPDADGNPPQHYLIAVLDFTDGAALQAALGSEAGQEAVADLANFAQAGVTIVTGPAVHA